MRIADVDHPLPEERCDVHVVGRGAREELRVRGPSHALVALRAIRGHGQKVAALSPDDVGMQLIEQCTRAFETRCLRQLIVNDLANDGVQFGLGLEIAHGHKAETVDGERRLVNLFRRSARDIGVFLAGRSQVRNVNASILVQRLGVLHTHECAAREIADRESHPTHHVLSEVEYPAPVRSAMNRLRA